MHTDTAPARTGRQERLCGTHPLAGTSHCKHTRLLGPSPGRSPRKTATQLASIGPDPCFPCNRYEVPLALILFKLHRILTLLEMLCNFPRFRAQLTSFYDKMSPRHHFLTRLFLGLSQVDGIQAAPKRFPSRNLSTASYANGGPAGPCPPAPSLSWGGGPGGILGGPGGVVQGGPEGSWGSGPGGAWGALRGWSRGVLGESWGSWGQSWGGF